MCMKRKNIALNQKKSKKHLTLEERDPEFKAWLDDFMKKNRKLLEKLAKM